MMFLAVNATIPWKGLLLAYGAGQLAATLPFTPGGLGVVEGSITIALVAFGGAHVSTVDAVLMYRVISFWLVLVVGWVLWAQLAFQVRRGRWTRHALEAPVEAELGPDGVSRTPCRLRASRPSRGSSGEGSPQAKGRGSAHVGGRDRQLRAGRRRSRRMHDGPQQPRHVRQLVLPRTADGDQGGQVARASARRAEVLAFGAQEEGPPPPAGPRYRLRPVRKRCASSRSRGSSRPDRCRTRVADRRAIWPWWSRRRRGTISSGTVIFTKAPLHFGHSHLGLTAPIARARVRACSDRVRPQRACAIEGAMLGGGAHLWVRRSLALTDRSKRWLSVVIRLHPGGREGPLMTHHFPSGWFA